MLPICDIKGNESNIGNIDFELQERCKCIPNSHILQTHPHTLTVYGEHIVPVEPEQAMPTSTYNPFGTDAYHKGKLGNGKRWGMAMTSVSIIVHNFLSTEVMSIKICFWVELHMFFVLHDY